MDLDVDLSRSNGRSANSRRRLTGHQTGKAAHVRWRCRRIGREVQTFLDDGSAEGLPQRWDALLQRERLHAERETLVRRCRRSSRPRSIEAHRRLRERFVRPRLFLSVGLRALRTHDRMDYEAWFLKEALEELVPFSDGVEVQEDGLDWLVTYPTRPATCPLP